MDAASLLEEIDELSKVVSIQTLDGDADVGHAAIHVSQLCAQLGHLVHLIHALAGKEVEAVEILLVAGEEHLVLGVLHADDRLENRALAILDPLTHRMQVGGEVHAGRVDTLLVLTFALAKAASTILP